MVDRKVDRKPERLENDDEKEKALENKAKPATEKELALGPCFLVHALSFPEAETKLRKKRSMLL